MYVYSCVCVCVLLSCLHTSGCGQDVRVGSSIVRVGMGGVIRVGSSVVRVGGSGIRSGHGGCRQACDVLLSCLRTCVYAREWSRICVRGCVYV